MATDGFELDQDPPDTVELTVVEVPLHNVESPAVKVPAFVKVVIVTKTSNLAVLSQPVIVCDA